MSLREQKAALRQAMLARREALSQDEWTRASARVQAQLLASPEYQRAGTILFYWAVGREARSQGAIAAALQEGKRVVLPRVVNWRGQEAPRWSAPVYGVAGKGLALHQYRRPEDLEAGIFGLQEPAPHTPAVQPKELDLVVVPGVVFDRLGGRIGHGGGYYDRFLPHLPPAVPRLGYCFAFQVVDRLPRGPHDATVTGLVTEDGVLRCPPGSGDLPGRCES